MKKIKEIFRWLFSDFVYSLYEIAGQKFCKFIAFQHQFALFRVNFGNPLGIEIPNTRFEKSDPVNGLISANPTGPYSVFHELNGHATISIAAGDVIELRLVTPGFGASTNLQSQTGTSLTSSMNIEKVGDPIILS